jgi:GAF domain-containing protein
LIGTLVVGLQGKKLFKSSELWFLVSLTQQTAVILESLRLRDELWHTAETFLGEEITEICLAEEALEEFDLDIPLSFDLPQSSLPSPQPAEDDLELLLAAMMDAEDELQRQNTDLQTLNALSEMMNQTLDPKEILQQSVEQTRHILQADAAWIYLVNEKEELGLRAQTGLSDVYVRGMQCLSPGDGPEGRAAQENKAVFVDNLAADTRNYKIWVDKEGLEALAAVPLTTPNPVEERGNPATPVIGVLAVGKQTGAEVGQLSDHAWTPRESRLLTSIANQVALAINNARLYAQVQEKEISVRTGNEVLRTINDMLLEKNAFLEGVIEDELLPDLKQASTLFHQFLKTADPVLAKTHRPELAALQQIISRLNRQVREINSVNTALDTELKNSIHQDRTPAEYTGSSTPPRLDKARKS